jgi:hypothetical protein
MSIKSASFECMLAIGLAPWWAPNDTGDFRQGRNTDHRDENEDKLLLFPMNCLENVCVCEYYVVRPPHVLRVGAYIGIISRHMTVGSFQPSPSGRQLLRLMLCMYLNVTSCMTIDDIKCHDMTLKTPYFETGPSKQDS